MKREALKGASIGLAFSGIAYILVTFIGYRWISLTALLYLYVFMGLLTSIYFKLGSLESGFTDLLDRVVIVAEEEDLRMRKLFSGEKYKIKGKVERLQ